METIAAKQALRKPNSPAGRTGSSHHLRHDHGQDHLIRPPPAEFQHKRGAHRAPPVDLKHACTVFVTPWRPAPRYFRAAGRQTILVVAGETLRPIS